jgi:hypothetical protein
MSQQLEAMKQGIQQIMAGAKRVDAAREMPSDDVWQRQARQLIEQRSASLLAALSEQELLAVATGQISLAELWKAS